MSFKCKILGHKWNVYKEDIPYFFATKDFRICDRCYYKQVRDHCFGTIRYHYTGKEKNDWSEYVLSTEELRDKKLKELGI
jgi:hypothetical protein